MKNLIASFLTIMLVINFSCGNPAKTDTYPIKPLVDYGNANAIVDLVLFKVNRALPK